MSQREDIRRRMITVVLSLVILGVSLFAAAGTLHWLRGWVYLGAQVVMLAINGAILLRVNPEVIAARARKTEGTKPFDKVFAVVFSIELLALPIVAGLDSVRWGTPAFGWAAASLGLALLVLGDALVVWAMAVNPFLEKTVRIQHERDHHVITTGPYRFVRHPMYVGVIVQYLGTPLLLGSAWAFVVTASLVVSLVVRTALEDRTLRAELPGYEDYTASTRYRLIPGVW